MIPGRPVYKYILYEYILFEYIEINTIYLLFMHEWNEYRSICILFTIYSMFCSEY